MFNGVLLLQLCHEREPASSSRRRRASTVITKVVDVQVVLGSTGMASAAATLLTLAGVIAK